MEVKMTARAGYVLVDRRDPDEKPDTRFLVVARDKVLSGWGQAPRYSFFAVPAENLEQAFRFKDKFLKREDFERVTILEFSGGLDPLLPYHRLGKGDHLVIESPRRCGFLWV